LWQRRVLVATILGYAVFYFVRKNIGTALPAMEADLHIRKSQLGLFLTLHGLLYGLSKFVNGFLGDRANARIFMIVGLTGSALVNIWFGMSSTVVALGSLWMLNGCFQGMGFPPCARLLTHWFPPRVIATKWSVWNMSHSLGAGIIAVLCGYLVGGGWRLCFWVPAAVGLVCVLFLWRMLPDTPPSVGLPEVEGTTNPEAPDAPVESFASVAMEKVFLNPVVWLVSAANFFVYTIRYVLLDWGPSFLSQSKHIQLSHAGWMIGSYEICGMMGALLAGWLTDKLFGGRGARACLFFMALSGVALFAFWKNPSESELVNMILLSFTGFFIYGPQCLVAVIAANLATKRAAATAVGLTGIFGYGSTVLSGVGLGWLVEHHGWDAGFKCMLVVVVIGTVLFAAAWGAKAHGYAQKSKGS
jgi:OPA family glycerol-3-phosphate transporter-like MFS transporter/OPA family sugar phosphate sensor protein UhpC-like MFS transporter